MMTLMPEFAQAITESNRRAATCVDDKVRRLDLLRERFTELHAQASELDSLRQRAAREARAGTRDLMAEAREMEEVWSSAIAMLGQNPPMEMQLSILRCTREMVESNREVMESLRRLWALVERMGGTNEGHGDLADAARLFDKVHSESTRAWECRTTKWQPADPVRLQLGKDEINSGKAIGPDEARARFRTDPNQSASLSAQVMPLFG